MVKTRILKYFNISKMKIATNNVKTLNANGMSLNSKK